MLKRILGAALVASVVVALSCSDDNGGPVEPDPTGAVTATVTGDGAALPGVTVRLFAAGGTSALTSGNTNAQGQVTFASRAPGSYEVEVVVVAGFELAAGESARKPVTIEADQTAQVTFALEEIEVEPTEGQLRVRVLSAGSGVAGVETRLFEAGGTMALETLTTGTDGRALFVALAPAEYDVEITVPEGFALEESQQNPVTATVTAGVTTDVAFLLVSQSGVVDVTASGTSFTPDDIIIGVGTTVRWTNADGSVFHTVTPDGHSEWSRAELNPGETFEHTFQNAGTFEYFCEPHVSFGMTGVIRVQ